MLRDNRLRQGFTLVELLVVIGILTVLVALLLPALSKVRKHALEVKCAANLRSIGQALTMYTQHHGYYPGGFIYTPPSGGYALWPVRLRTFMGGEQGAFYCPAADERSEWTRDGPSPFGRATTHMPGFGYEAGEPLLDWERSHFSYGYNVWGNGDVNASTYIQKGLGTGVLNRSIPVAPRDRDRFRELRASRVKNPARMIAIADSTPDGVCDFMILPHDTDSQNIARKPRWVSSVHRGGANVLFCDGHVEWQLQADLIIHSNVNDRSEFVRRCMWNNDHDPDYN